MLSSSQTSSVSAGTGGKSLTNAPQALASLLRYLQKADIPLPCPSIAGWEFRSLDGRMGSTGLYGKY